MKSWASVGRIAACILVSMALGFSSNAEAAVGRTHGTYSVSQSGAATYTIPIWAPKGPNGLQPAVSLVYSSQNGSGPLGVGWSLSGLSSITRCDQTYAQNSTAGPITLTSQDIFCLDGEELRLTGGTYGAPASTYQTELANFENVTAVGVAGNGPAYFTVRDRYGRSYEYGNGGGSQVLAAGTSTPWTWWLDKVTDPAGNTMTITYNNSNGTAVPNIISWTPSAYGSSIYNYTMAFAYGTNAQASSTYGYVAGTPYSNTNLLTSISVNYSGATVKKYALTYQLSPTTARDELSQVQECADAAQTNCLAPTTIQYQPGAAGFSSTPSTLSLGGAAPPWYLAGYDVNGDGYKDLIYQIGGTWYVAFASATGYGTPINTGITTPGYTPGKGTLLVGDLFGSGRYGLLARSGGGTGVTWHYWTWNGASFSEFDTQVVYDTTATAFALADVNGDGLPDLVSLNLGVGSAQAVVYVYMKDVGGSPAFEPATIAYTNNDNRPDQATGGTFHTTDIQHAVPIQKVDLNGDGRDDLVLHLQFFDAPDHIHYPQSYVLLANGTTFTGTTVPFQATSAYFLNWNDDGCTDFLEGSSLYLSECNGASAATITLPVTPLAVIDWNGDGRQDVLYQSAGILYVAPSNGQGLGAGVSTGITYNSSLIYTGADINGDGLDDLMTESLGAGTIGYNLHSMGNQAPDLLSSLTDGYGNFVKPTYAPLVQSSVYVIGTDATYPYANYIGPLYVVDQTTFNDPSSSSGGTYQQSMLYHQAWMNLQGRGFAGFEHTRTHDSRTGADDHWFYNLAYPYTGMPTEEVYNLPTVTERIVQNTLATIPLDSTPGSERSFPYISNTTIQRKEVGGPEDTQPIDTDSTSYSYDNYGNATQVIHTLTDTDPGSPYVGDSWTTTTTNTPDVSTGTWCLGLFSESQISYTASNASLPVTRSQSFTPDLANCRYTQIVTEPLSSSYMVTEALGYDSFGNVNSDTKTGINMTARQTTANWGTTGQFPASVTDATAATTHFGYNFSYGLVSSKTDPNGLSTSWAYGDGFGRLTQETRPDGTYTVYTYNDCVNWGGCLIGSHTLALAHYFYSTDGSIETDGTTYFDALGRPLISNKMMLASGTYDRNEVRYDSLGRVAQRAFPCAWGAVSVSCPYWTTYSYDGLNRVTVAERPISQSVSTLQATTYGYEGRTTTITDPQGHSRTLIHDVNGWLRQTKDDLGYAVTLAYDAAGAKTSVTDTLGSTLWTGTYAYGTSSFLVSESDVDRGAWTYTLDALGERTKWIDPKGKIFFASYDALSRPISRVDPDLFTHWTWGNSAASHNIGRLQTVCTGTGYPCSSSYFYSETETYDNLGRLSQRSIAVPAVATSTYTWQYNATTGLLDTLTYPVSTSTKALQLKYAYQNGLLQSVTDVLDSPNITIWQANAENAAGQVTQETLGNGLVTTRAFDAVTQWLQSVQSGPGGAASLQNQSFLYDEVGNVSQRQDNNRGLTENFYYDNDYRLKYSTLNGTPNFSLTYDPMGNITSRSDVASGATWTYDPVHLHRVTQAGSAAYQYAYDANGNVTSRQGSTITWASYNYPTLINDTATGESVSLSYGPDRAAFLEQTQGPSGTEVTYHIGGLFDIVISGSVTDYRHYIYAGNEPVAIDSRKSSGTNALYYLLSDQERSVAAITNSTGGAVVNESFTAYGTRRNPTTWSGPASSSDLSTSAGVTRRGYTFQRALATMGLNHMIGRVQDAITGRWLSADPTIPDPSDPQSYNRYSYVTNNPLTYTDPTGFSSECQQLQGDQGSQNYDCVPFPGPGVTVTGQRDNGGPAPPPPPPQFVSPGLPSTGGDIGQNSSGGNQGSDNSKGPGQSPSHPCGNSAGGTNAGPRMGPPSSGGSSGSNEADSVGADAGLALSDIGLQAADRFTQNVKAPPGVNLGAIGVLSKGVTALGLGMSTYQALYGSTSQARAQGTQDTAVNGFGTVFPAAAPFTSIPYDLGRMARELYDAWKDQQAAKFLDSIAKCGNS